MRRSSWMPAVLACLVFAVLLLGRAEPAYAFKMAAHLSLAEKTRDSLPEGSVIKKAMTERPSMMAWGSYGPDIAFGQWAVAFGGLDFIGLDAWTPWADEFHYQRVGTMGRVMMQRAIASGDQDQIAFAAGWITHVTGDMAVHGILVNPEAKKASGGSGIYFEDVPSRELHQELEKAADTLLWQLKGGHTGLEYQRLVFSRRYQPMPPDNVDDFFVKNVSDVYRNLTPYEPDHLDDITNDEFDGMTEFIYNGSILGGVPGLYMDWDDARDVIPSGSAREQMMFRAFDRGRDKAAALLSGAERGDYHGFTDAWNLDMIEPGPGGDGVPHGVIGTLNVRVRTDGELYSGTDNDVFFKMTCGGTYIERELDTSRIGIPLLRDFPSDFERNVVDDYHILVPRSWSWWPDWTSTMGLRKTTSNWDGDWQPSDVWVYYQGRLLEHFTPEELPWFTNSVTQWSKAVNHAAWAAPPQVGSLTAGVVDFFGMPFISLSWPTPNAYMVRLLRSDKAFATSAFDTDNGQELVGEWGPGLSMPFYDSGESGKTYYYTLWARNQKGIFEPYGRQASVVAPVAPKLELAAPLEFSPGPYRYGQPMRVKATVKNVGGEAGTWTTIKLKLGSQDVQLWGGAYTLAPGQTKSVEVTFSPTVKGEVNVNLLARFPRYLNADVYVTKVDAQKMFVGAGATRISGDSRYSTAIAAAKAGAKWGSYNSSVVIATGDAFPDALAAAPFARAVSSPLLLWNPKAPAASYPNTEVVRYIRDEWVTAVYIIGSEKAIPDSIKSAITSASPETRTFIRHGGVNRYATAAALAAPTRFNQTGGAVVLATGANYPDALSVASLAAKQKWPILLTPTDRLSPEASAAIAAQKPDKVIVVGSESVVSKAVYDAVPVPAAAKVRLGGSDRYDTCAKIAAYALQNGMFMQYPALVLGTNYPDALAAGPMIATKSGVTLLTRPDTLPAPIRSLVESRGTDTWEVQVVGGANVLPDARVSDLLEAIPKIQSKPEL